MRAMWKHWNSGTHRMDSEPVEVLSFLMAPGYQSQGDYGALYYNEPVAMAVVKRDDPRLSPDARFLVGVPVTELFEVTDADH